MRYLLFTCLLIGCFFEDPAQNPNWLWAKAAKGTDGLSIQETIATAVDADGNVYATGRFVTSKMIFGTDTLMSYGAQDIFLVKYDSYGAFQWAKHAGGNRLDMGWGVATFGNFVYLTGYCFSPLSFFDSDTLRNLGVANTADAFLAKYDSDGNVIWITNAHGANNDYAQGISVDNHGDIYVTGSFESPIITFQSTSLHNKGWADIFFVKYDSNGNVLWAKSAGGNGIDEGAGIAEDSIGNVYITGAYNSSYIVFGLDTFINRGGYDIILAKYSANGNPLWAKTIGGAYNDFGWGIASYGSNIYITGYFESSNISINTINVVNTDTQYHFQDMFIAKFDGSGNGVWAKGAGGIADDNGWGLATDDYGNVFVTGGYSESISFDSITLTHPIGHCMNQCDPMYIVKYNSDGQVLCASSLTSGGDDIAAIATDVYGNVYVAGDFMDTSFIVGSDTLPLAGEETFFVAKYSCGNISGISESATSNPQSTVSISPNPFSSSLSIFLQKESRGFGIQQIDFTVTNIIGQPVYTKHESNLSSTYTKTLDLSYLPAGVYFLEVIADGERSVKELVKE